MKEPIRISYINVHITESSHENLKALYYWQAQWTFEI